MSVTINFRTAKRLKAEDFFRALANCGKKIETT